MVWGLTSALLVCCGVGLLLWWIVGLSVCWSVGSLLCWFSGLLVVCLSAVWPQSPRPGGGWPAGQLDPAPPKGSAVLDQKPNPSGMLTIVKLQALRVVPPRPNISLRAGHLVLLGSNLALSWSNLAVLSAMFVHLVQSGSYLAPTWSIFAPTWLNLAPTWPNLVPSWPNLAPTWSNFGPNLVPKSDQDELQEVFSSLSKRSSVFY